MLKEAINPATLANAVGSLVNKAKSLNTEKAKQKQVLHAEILDQLKANIKPVNFSELAELEEDEKLNNSHFQIIVVEQVLILAE
ncbi:hypothetical protein [Adhaeribacter aquaticus]|uniref:hypothetical protein n=1 Tax=Adhaeribacter aquaticus TaxID=299567 RepID=UPI0004246E87|nr:hypothetical protein [Adhaeribacter aquaticus]